MLVYMADGKECRRAKVCVASAFVATAGRPIGKLPIVDGGDTPT